MNDAPNDRTPRLAYREAMRSFWCLFITQFQGAFSDNVFKFLVTFLIVGMMPPAQRDRLVPLVGALFALPFILFSMAGGHLADRFSKRDVAVTVKAAEIGIMTLAVLGFAFGHIPLLLAVVFLMSTQSAFFGPTKYGLLPELLAEKQLSWGNGIIGLGTFTSVIAGTIAAGALSNWLGRGQVWSGVMLVTLACVGTISAAGIARLPAANPGKIFRPNFLADLLAQFRSIRGDRTLLIAVLASNYIWFLGALLQPTLIFYGKDVLRLDDLHIGYVQAALAVGIGLGSAASGYLSAKKIEIGFVPLGALGLAVFGALLARPGLSTEAFSLNLVLLGFWGGFYVVPVNALVQYRPDPRNKGSVIAASAFLSWIGIFAASGLYYVLRNVLELEQASIFLVGAGLSLLGTVAIAWAMPESILRLVLWFLTRTFYRVHVLGRDNIPERGGALFVCNHLSLADAVLLQASTDRPIRFMMLKENYELPPIKPWARISRAIPISPEQRPREMIQSLRMASDAIRAGDVVCIFAEGQITRTGQLLPFRRGLERIMKDVAAPIVPVALDGVWGSIFSFERGRFYWKWPRHVPYHVTVNYGPPLPPGTTPFAVRQAVQELLTGAWNLRKARMQPLQRAFVRTARRHPRRFAMADAQTPKVSFGSALVRTVLLARRLQQVWAGPKMVGLLLPPSVPGALANWAALLCGKVPVNLNYTLSEESLASCVRQCNIKTVITSRVFLEKIKLKPPGDVVLLEDVVASPTATEKWTTLLMAGLLPAGWLERALRRNPDSQAGGNGDDIGETRGNGRLRSSLDDLATVIFSSGSMGDPKGVMLSHYNIASNIEQLRQVFAFADSDRILGILPFFHSFGFTATLALPGVLGVGVVFHANPLDARTVGHLARKHAATFLLATPTFLQFYTRGCAPEDFGGLRLVIAGAEKLPEPVAAAFEQRFGLRPLEGYGCTECSPAVAVNRPDFRSAGFHQIGAKRGTIGQPLPAVCVRIVDPVSFAPLPVGEPGLLLVRGPNVMRGYLGLPEKTAEALPDGWYVTGDIATLDEDGFLQITDRLSRFSKIGGEMVPHIKVEEKLHELAGAQDRVFVVTSLADESKGERLVVLHRLADELLQVCLGKLAQCDLPNLWKPKPDAFHRVEAFPLLGSGKLDLRKVKELAQKLAG